MRLAAKHGGGDIIAANLKAVFTHLAAACQFLPAVAEMLSGFGFHKEQIDSALDLAGVQWCLDALAERQVFVRFDGSVVSGARPSSVLEACALPWGQARKLHSEILDALQLQALSSLRERFVHGLGDAGSERALARLHSCSGEVSSRWLTEFPASWWPSFGDDKFLMAFRFRFGIPIVPEGYTCQHSQCKDRTVLCGKDLDKYGDHAVMCNTGPFIFARHARVNNTIAQASRDAGYAALLEQVVPELGLRKKTHQSGQVTLEEAFLDVERFGYPTAPDRLLDATVRHPAAKGIVKKAASQRGAAASEGAACKEKRYPPRAGKSVIPCALEIWGFADVKVINLLDELAVLASQRQRDRGLVPTRWRRKWLTSLSVGLALDVGKSILAALPSLP